MTTAAPVPFAFCDCLALQPMKQSCLHLGSSSPLQVPSLENPHRQAQGLVITWCFYVSLSWQSRFKHEGHLSHEEGGCFKFTVSVPCGHSGFLLKIASYFDSSFKFTRKVRRKYRIWYTSFPLTCTAHPILHGPPNKRSVLATAGGFTLMHHNHSFHWSHSSHTCTFYKSEQIYDNFHLLQYHTSKSPLC